MKLRGKVRLGDVHLKKMGEDLKLPFNLHLHLSRHTFATNALNNGMWIEYVSKLLDHSTIQQTQVYAKIVSEELDNAVDKYVN
ncbi:MAG: tyrosine-type recombinase/integrase [Siphonobacter sp.]